MSKNTIWATKGQWSEVVDGCDKVLLMKQVIERELEKFQEAHKTDRGLRHVKRYSTPDFCSSIYEYNTAD